MRRAGCGQARLDSPAARALAFERGKGSIAMPARKTWLEVSLNGPWTRRVQPGIPIAVEDIVAQAIACVHAGAAIVHVHAYDEATGRQNDDPDLYAAIIAGVRAEVDAIVYPRIPLAASGDAPAKPAPRERYAAIAALAERGLVEWAVVDPGTVNLARFDAIAGDREGFVYLNPESDIRAGLALAARHRFHPAYACYEAGFVRLGAALARRYPAAPKAIYRLMFSDAFAFGFPPEPFALDAYRKLLEREAPRAPWMSASASRTRRSARRSAISIGSPAPGMRSRRPAALSPARPRCGPRWPRARRRPSPALAPRSAGRDAAGAPSARRTAAARSSRGRDRSSS